MREVTLFNYIIVSIMSIFNFGILLYTFESMPWNFIYLTNWSQWASTVYLCFIFVCDTTIYFFENERFEKANEYIRNTYSRYCFSYGYSVAFLYWFLVCLGDNYMRFDTRPWPMFLHIYLHALITVFLLIDLILTPHKLFSWSNWDFMIVSLAFLTYVIITLISKYGFFANAYAFMKNAPFWQLLLCALGMYALHIAAYALHIWVVKLKNNGCKIKPKQTQELLMSKEKE